jgi:hypothetical protein
MAAVAANRPFGSTATALNAVVVRQVAVRIPPLLSQVRDFDAAGVPLGGAAVEELRLAASDQWGLACRAIRKRAGSLAPANLGAQYSALADTVGRGVSEWLAGERQPEQRCHGHQGIEVVLARHGRWQVVE